MAVGSGRSTLGSEIEKRIEEISDFHYLPSIFATKLDCLIDSSLDVCSCSYPLFEQD